MKTYNTELYGPKRNGQLLTAKPADGNLDGYSFGKGSLKNLIPSFDRAYKAWLKRRGLER